MVKKISYLTLVVWLFCLAGLAPITSAAEPAAIPPPPGGCMPNTVANTNNTSVPIPAIGTITSTLSISSVGTVLWDLDMHLSISHTFNQDVAVYLISPTGITMTVTSNNGGSRGNVFVNTHFDDQADNPVSDIVYVNGVNVPMASPEETFAAANGTDPNGVWTLVVTDTGPMGTGILNGWTLDVTTCQGAPDITYNTFDVPGVVIIPDPGTLTSTLVVSTTETRLCELELNISISHTDSADLDIFLISPGGVTMTVTTDNGGGFNFNFVDSHIWAGGGTPVTDFPYANDVNAAEITPEEPFALVNGTDPNGTWTLIVGDDTFNDNSFHSLNGWSLTTGTCQAGPTAVRLSQLQAQPQGTPPIAIAAWLAAGLATAGLLLIRLARQRQVGDVK